MERYGANYWRGGIWVTPGRYLGRFILVKLAAAVTVGDSEFSEVSLGGDCFSGVNCELGSEEQVIEEEVSGAVYELLLVDFCFV